LPLAQLVVEVNELIEIEFLRLCPLFDDGGLDRRDVERVQQAGNLNQSINQNLFSEQ